MAFNEFPKTFYRYNDEGEKIGRTFNAAEEVERGWVDHDDLGPPPAPKKPKTDGQGAVDAGKRLVAAESENVRLKDTLKLYEDFLANLRADKNCPDALKAAIGELFDGEAKPKAKRAPKA